MTIDGPRILNVIVEQPVKIVFTTRRIDFGQKVKLEMVGKPTGAIFTTAFNDDTGLATANLTWIPSSSSFVPNLRF